MTCNKGGGDHVAPGNSGERGALLPTRVGLSLITLLTLALVALPRSASADADPPAAARAIKTLVVFTPGVDPLESRSTYDPYVRAVSTFATDSNGQPSASSIMGRLGCPLNPPTPPA